MESAYVILIKAKRRTIDTVPEKFQEEVLRRLNAEGYDGYGDKLEEFVA